MQDRPATLIAQLKLIPHPEGGHFGEFFRSSATVTREGARRSALTAIYFLLRAGEFSRWHAVSSDEQWTHVEGDPVKLFVMEPGGGSVATIRLGPLALGCEPVSVVPAGHWQAARPTGGYGLVVCSVAPGFEFEDFRFLKDDAKALAALRELRELA